MQRKKRKEKSFLKRVFRIFFVVLVVFTIGRLCIYVLYSLNKLQLNIGKITISGNRNIPDSEVLNVMALRNGENIISIKTSVLEKRLQNVPRIDFVQVKKNYPDSLDVMIEEILPVGYLKKNGKKYIVTFKGKIIPGNLEEDESQIEFRVEDIQNIKNMTEFLLKMKEQNIDFFYWISVIEYNYRGEINTYTKDYFVKWPVLDDTMMYNMEKNAYLIKKVQNQYKKEGKEISYIDLRFIRYIDNEVSGTIIVK